MFFQGYCGVRTVPCKISDSFARHFKRFVSERKTVHLKTFVTKNKKNSAKMTQVGPLAGSEKKGKKRRYLLHKTS